VIDRGRSHVLSRHGTLCLGRVKTWGAKCEYDIKWPSKSKSCRLSEVPCREPLRHPGGDRGITQVNH